MAGAHETQRVPALIRGEPRRLNAIRTALEAWVERLTRS